MCVVEVQIQEIQIDGLKSCLNGTFLLLREGVTSPMRANYMVKFYS